MALVESQKSFETNNSVVNTDISESKKFDNSLTKVVKTKVKILKLLDDADVPEENQDNLLNKVLKYQDNKKVFDILLEKIRNSFDENDILKYLKEAETNNKEAETNNKEAIYISTIRKQLEWLNWEHSWNYSELLELLEKGEYDKMITELQKPNVIPSIAEDLWWVWSEKYEKFKSSLVSIDSSFSQYFVDYENIKSWKSVEIWDIVSSVEKDSAWVVDIDLEDLPPLSKLSVVGSNYSFDEKIDIEELNDLNYEHREELWDLESWISNLKSFWSDFDDFLYNVWKSWWKDDFIADLSNHVDDFIVKASSDLQDMTNYLWEDVVSLTTSDILDMKNINNPEDLRWKIENIQNKINSIRDYVVKQSSAIYKTYEKQIKELLKQEEDKKKEQLKTLHFLHSIWFDRIPKNITDSIIAQINLSKWTYGLNTDIDLKNWILGFSDGIDWNSVIEKQDFIKLFNKMISWDPENPVSLSIANWSMWAIQAKNLKQILDSPLMKIWWVWKAMENLKKEVN